MYFCCFGLLNLWFASSLLSLHAPVSYDHQVAFPHALLDSSCHVKETADSAENNQCAPLSEVDAN